MVMQQLEQKFKKELKEQQESSSNQANQLNSTIRRLEKENKALNERLEMSSKNMMSEQGGLEKKLERVADERDRLKEEFETVKADRDKKIEEMRRQFEREKEVLKQKNNDLQQKNKATEAKQTELILSHETNRAKWDQEKSILISAKEDAISESKNAQKQYLSSVKEIERLKESQKRNNQHWRMANKERVGGMQTNNAMMLKMGEGMLGRLNLGGAGGAGSRPGNELSASQSNLNFGKSEMGTYRSNLGVDKSMDNFKIGMASQFGAHLGQPNLGSKVGSGLDSLSNAGKPGQGVIGAVSQPQSLGAAMKNANPLDSSMRGSNILSTPSSKGGHEDDFEKQ